MVTAEICETLYVCDCRDRPPPPPSSYTRASAPGRARDGGCPRARGATILPHPGPNLPLMRQGGWVTWSTVDHNQVVGSDKYLPVAQAAIDRRIRPAGGLWPA